LSVALAQARLRVFAGPNGSGKSTIRDELKDEWIGVYVNADEIESALKRPAGLNLDAFDLMLGEAELTVQAACNASNRAYVFDNSGDAHRLIAEITDGEVLTLHTDTLPAWLTATALWRSFQTA
jgi:predicted ABC-type ATPase